jgi:NAD(P)H-flavin reductase
MANPGKFISVVKEIFSYGDGIYRVIFELKNGMAKFKPGQFLHLTLDEYDPSNGYWPESRVFSIASLPNSKEIEIVYSIKGKYTKRMSEELKEGKEVWLKFPYGDFIIDKYVDSAKKIFLVAGGTGVSPFIPFLKKYINGFNVPIVIYYGIRNDNFYLYKELMETIKDKVEVNVISGIMDINKISKEIVSSRDSKCFISGPPLMIKLFKESLLLNGMGKENIIIDEWE